MPFAVSTVSGRALADVATYDRLRGLELEIDSVRTERFELEVSSGFTRVTTVIVLAGGGIEGRGEDVTYEAADHSVFPRLEHLRGRWTLDDVTRSLAGTELFPSGPPASPVSRNYRRWAVESAALDLALRQAGCSLSTALGIPYSPVRFVISTRLDPRAWLELDPRLEFKLDPTSDWERAHMEALAATGRIRVLDFKAYYTGTIVDQEPDPVLYRAVKELFPDAIIEDASLDANSREALRGAEDRLSWDAPIHSLEDVEALPLLPRFLNVKPSRFGSLADLLETIDACQARGVAMYGGGQFELAVGRGQLQALASLFYPDGPNDVAPSAYNEPEPRPGLPPSPLPVPVSPVGFSFGPS
jgi:hypothetical protein